MSYFNTLASTGNTPELTDYEVVMEHYVGKDKDLVSIELDLAKLITVIKGGSQTIFNKQSGTIKTRELNASELNRSIEAKFKKFFRLKDFRLFWTQQGTPNASTICKTFQVFDKNMKVDTKSGRDYNENLKLRVFAHTSLVTIADMNAAEVMSIILHEIGHNFYKSYIQILHDFGDGLMGKIPWNKMSMFLLSPLIREFVDIGGVMGYVRELPDTVIDELNLRPLLNTVYEVQTMVEQIQPKAYKNIRNLIKNPIGNINPIYSLSRYAMERHADSFAVDYGYGAANITAQRKMDGRVRDNLIYDIPVYNWIIDLDTLLFDTVVMTFRGYPTAPTREFGSLKRLKAAAKDPDMPPEVKKELMQQIKECEDLINDLEKFDDVNKKRVFTWAYRKVIYKYFDGVLDPREILYRFTKEYDSNDTWTRIEKTYGSK